VNIIWKKRHNNEKHSILWETGEIMQYVIKHAVHITAASTNKM